LSFPAQTKMTFVIGAIEYDMGEFFICTNEGVHPSLEMLTWVGDGTENRQQPNIRVIGNIYEKPVDAEMNPSGYKKYRVYLNTNMGGFFIASSNTVNNLVDLSKYWLERTTAGMSLPESIKGHALIQVLNEETGAYVGQTTLPFQNKDEIVEQVRKLGGR
jgi:hypothetical protein